MKNCISINKENKIIKLGNNYFKIEGYHTGYIKKIDVSEDNIKFRKVRHIYVDNEVFDNGNITILNTKDNIFIIDYFYASVWAEELDINSIILMYDKKTKTYIDFTSLSLSKRQYIKHYVDRLVYKYYYKYRIAKYLFDMEV